MKQDPWGTQEQKWPADWAPLKKRNKSRSRSPAAERTMPAPVEKLADLTTPKKGEDQTKRS